MPYRPGTQVILRDIPTPRSVPVDTGQALVVGMSERGSTTLPTKLRSMIDFVKLLGDRQSYSGLYDWAETYFREGGATLYVQRVVGAAAATATKVLQATGAVNTLNIFANSPGAWGNSLKVAVLTGTTSGTVQLQVLRTINAVDVVLEQSPDMFNKAEILSWAAGSQYITATDNAGSTLLPLAIAATPLLTGADDNASVVDANYVTGLTLLTADLGPGQVAIPGRTSATILSALQAHAQLYNRFYVYDLVDTSTKATLEAAAQAGRSNANARYGMVSGSWVTVPPLPTVPGTTRTVAGSSVICGLIARSEGNGNTSNVPPAGDNGVLRFALGTTQTFTDADADELYSNGINLIRSRYGTYKLFGFRTLVDPYALPLWINAANVRQIMAIYARANAIAERFVLAQLDGKGLKVADFGAQLKSMLKPYFDAGSLYGDPSDPQNADLAYRVDVGSIVNTPTTIQNGELHAVLSLRLAPFAELVVIELVRAGITDNI